jgi:hypothetical protein
MKPARARQEKRMAQLVSRRTALVGGLAVAASAGGLYTATSSLADVSAAAFTQRWAPDPGKDGLNAFGGIEDDRRHSHPGVKHIFAEPNQYRVVMHVRDRDYNGDGDLAHADRQRNEVRGIRNDMRKGETWRYTYQMYLPDTLKGTTTFSHIFQVKHVAVGSPVVTMSLGRSGSRETIEMRMYGSGGATIGSTDLARLRNKWIDVLVDITVDDGKRGNLRFQLKDGATTVVDQKHSGDTWLGGNEAHPKWGIYRSLRDRSQLKDTYLLLRNMKAFRQQ